MASSEARQPNPLIRSLSASSAVRTEQAQQHTAYSPVRQESQESQDRNFRGSSQDEVQQRLMEEMNTFVHQNASWLLFLMFLLFTLLTTMAVLFTMAVMAALLHGDKPCDQPLKWYVFIVLFWMQVPGKLTEYLAHRLEIHDGDIRKVWISVFCTVPSWCLLWWGVYMVRKAKTCPKTNPELFYPTERYIYAQVIFMALLFVVSFFTALGLRHFLLWMNSLIVKPGCVEAVHKLPKIDPGSAELIDEMDGEALACIICLESFPPAGDNLTRSASSASVAPSAIVKTPCSHFFHEDCLANWCKNHMDCPMCREPVGDPDPKDGQAQPPMDEP